MYEMWAEHDPAVQQPVLLWHVLAKNADAKSLCGRQLEPTRRATPNPDDGPQLPDRYCDPCLNTVRETMAVPTN